MISCLMLCFSTARLLQMCIDILLLPKSLEKVEGENAKLKEAVAKMEEELRVLGQHSVVMECEASEASVA